jgi:DNA segregation ATPase FtsK/SpoIIIE-like protein
MPVNYGKELCLAFGDYVESYEGTTNTSKARSSACIALYPTANSTGAWVLWKIDSRTRVSTNYVKLVTNELIINAMNQIALSEEHEASQPEARVIAELEAQEEYQQEAQEESQQEAQEKSQQEAQEKSQQEAQEEPQQSIHNEGVQVPEIEAENAAETADETVRTRSGRAVVRPSRFAAVTKVSYNQWMMEENLKAINLELKMLF